MNPIDWCDMVALLCAPSMRATATANLVDMLPLLERRFPPVVFNVDTAEAIALGERRLAVPDLAEVTRALKAYRETFVIENPRLMLPEPVEPDREPPTPEQIAAVSAIVASLAPKRHSIPYQTPEAALRPPSAPLFTPEEDRRLLAIEQFRRDQRKRCNTPAPDNPEETRQ